MTMAQERTVPLSATGPASVKRRRLVLAKISVALAVLATAVLWVLLTPATPPVLPVSGMVVHVTGTPGLAFSGGITYPHSTDHMLEVVVNGDGSFQTAHPVDFTPP